MKKVLIVEDDLSYVQLLKDKIKELQCEVLLASDGKEGLDTALKANPDLILLDIRMPVMDGLTMLTELRKTQYGKKVAVIFLTNLEPDESTIKKVLKDQPTYYLIKSDIKRTELMEMIQKLLNENEAKSKKS